MQERLVDHMAILMMHQFAGGGDASKEHPKHPNSVAAGASDVAESHQRLTDLSHRLIGEDLLIQGRPVWGE
jgi:hypothetical protein